MAVKGLNANASISSNRAHSVFGTEQVDSDIVHEILEVPQRVRDSY